VLCRDRENPKSVTENRQQNGILDPRKQDHIRTMLRLTGAGSLPPPSSHGETFHCNGLSDSHEEISGRKKRIEDRTKYDAESEQAIDESSRGSTSTADVEGFR
jgi:hypothetical protein